MFIGIEFCKEDGGGVALVHRKWITPRKNEIWWPPFKQQDCFDKSLKRGESPNENWKLYGVSRTFFEEDDYKKALQKLRKAEFTSDITSDGEDILPPKRRSVAPRKLLYSSSDEEDLGYSPAPTVKGISHLVKRKLDETSFTKSSPRMREIQPENQEKIQSLQSELQGSSQEEVHQGSSQLIRSQQEGTPQQPSSFAEKDFKKILTYLVLIKNQNSEILNLLKQTKSATGKNLELPKDLPVSLPLKNARDLKLLEEYILEDSNLSSMVSYFGTLGGKDINNKTNTILRNLMSNTVAVDYSFLGTRQNKNSFQNLRLKKLITNAVLSTCSAATESDVDNAIKNWLKHAPKRLAATQKRLTV